MDYLLWPEPYSIHYDKGSFTIPETWVSSFKTISFDFIAPDFLELRLNKHFEPEEYKLRVANSVVMIEAGSPLGRLQALRTFKQLMSQKNEDSEIHCLSIHDKPLIERRAYLFDANYQRFPKLSYMRDFLNSLAEIKYNEFHFHFEIYPPINEKLEQNKYDYYNLAELSDLCQSLGMKFVLNFNILGQHRDIGENPLALPESIIHNENTGGSVGELDLNAPKLYPYLQSHFENYFDKINSHWNLNSYPDIDSVVEFSGKTYYNCFDFLFNLIAKKDRDIYFSANFIGQYPELYPLVEQYNIILLDMLESEKQNQAMKGIYAKETRPRIYVSTSTFSMNSLLGRQEIASHFIDQLAEKINIEKPHGILLTDFRGFWDNHLTAYSISPIWEFIQVGWAGKKNSAQARSAIALLFFHFSKADINAHIAHVFELLDMAPVRIEKKLKINIFDYLKQEIKEKRQNHESSQRKITILSHSEIEAIRAKNTEIESVFRYTDTYFKQNLLEELILQVRFTLILFSIVRLPFLDADYSPEMIVKIQSELENDINGILIEMKTLWSTTYLDDTTKLLHMFRKKFMGLLYPE